MPNTISTNIDNTSFIQRDFKAPIQEKKEIQTKNKESREVVKYLFQEAKKNPAPYTFLSSHDFATASEFYVLIHRERVEALMKSSRINSSVIEEHSQRFTNEVEERYQSAKAYIYQQMEEIALAVYEEEGKSDLLGTLLLLGGHISSIDRADKVFNEELESNAREFASSLETENKTIIAKAKEELKYNLTTISVASMIAFPSMLQFFILADSKIPAENLQKIKDSLGIMKSYIQDNYDISNIKTKNGLIIESSVEKGIRTLSVTLPFDKVENLILSYKEKNHQTLLEMFKYKEKLSKDSSINSRDSLMQTLLKEGKEEREKSIDKDRQTPMNI